MRVVSGIAGGIPLIAPKTDLRPTMDRVKGAIFDSLGEAIVGSRVLDLFAGSGALGIEALSRGAASATLVEKDTRAVEAIRANLDKTRLQGAVVEPLDIFSFLHKRAAEGGYDFILADPPYAKQKGDRDFGVELLSDPALARALAPEGLFVLEKLPGAPLPTKTGWELLRERRYGATEVAYLRRAAPGV
ncbi:MAG: 16S rRNA (guanine(966)-N(2))-methyltransferase RsmD [Chthoniobacteraceae bacterium]|nr:16S rRNA (guanine(966)-N(2))-methyltransferase RsmD [Chthoniobacteraceae bacterium]